MEVRDKTASYNDNFVDPYWEVTETETSIEDPVGGNEGVTAYDEFNFDPDLFDEPLDD